MEWSDLNDQQYFHTLRTMEEMGGSFVHNLGKAWIHADSFNRDRLEKAFPDMVDRFGPPSSLYLNKESVWE